VSTTNYNWNREHPRFLADLDGNGRADLVGIGADGVWSSLGQGDGGFAQPSFQLAGFEANGGWRTGDHPRFVVDLTGDGHADILGYGDDGPWVALGNGDGSFQPAAFVLNELGFNKGWTADFPRYVADLTGDGRPDVVGFGMDGTWVALGNGDGSFKPAALVSGDFGFNSGWRVDKNPRFVVDLTGDGHADILGFGDDGIWVALGNGDGTFQPAGFVLANLGANQGWRVEDHPRLLADLTGDGRPDVVGFGDAGVWVALSNGNGSFQEAKFVLADLGRASNPDQVVRREVIRDHRVAGRIKHLFVLMLENRSYDHMLGFADITGSDAATGGPTTADGLKGTEFNAFGGVRYPVIRGAPDVTVAPGHDFPDALEQLCGPRATYPDGGPYPEINNTGFVSSLAHNGYPDSGGQVMRCVDPEDLVILTDLAREFAVCDRWFSSMPGPTEPNRYFSHAASSADYDESPSTARLVEASTNHFGGIDFEGGQIFDALDDADVETRIYAGDDFPVVGELEGVSNTFDVHDFDEHFEEDLQDPDFDARFIHIEPQYFAGLLDTVGKDFGTGNSQHPSGGIAAGERLIKKTYEAIRNSPHWESSMLIITYDEHGGFYDHVAPGPAQPTGSKGSEHGFMFDQLGPRVPAVVISPLIPKHTIEHRLLEHCSIIKTACDLFDMPHLTHARDVDRVCGVLHLAQLSEPRTDTPARLRDVVVSDVTSEGAAPAEVGERHYRRATMSDVASAGPAPAVVRDHRAGHVIAGDLAVGTPGLSAQPVWSTQNSMIAMTLHVAAVRYATLEPQRKNEIFDRVAHITTPDEAAAFLTEVQGKLAAAKPS
jgi:hypothetical protein